MEWLWSCEDDQLRVYFCVVLRRNLFPPTLLSSTAPWCCCRCRCLLLSLLLPLPAANSPALLLLPAPDAAAVASLLPLPPLGQYVFFFGRRSNIVRSRCRVPSLPALQ